MSQPIADTSANNVTRVKEACWKLMHRVADRSDDVNVVSIPANPDHDADFIARDAAALLAALMQERDEARLNSAVLWGALHEMVATRSARPEPPEGHRGGPYGEAYLNAWFLRRDKAMRKAEELLKAVSPGRFNVPPPEATPEMVGRGDRELIRQYGASDWEDAKDVCEWLDLAAIYRAMVMPEPKA